MYSKLMFWQPLDFRITVLGCETVAYPGMMVSAFTAAIEATGASVNGAIRLNISRRRITVFIL
jgi:hypothetical protein